MLNPLFLLSALASAPLKSTWRKERYEELDKNICNTMFQNNDVTMTMKGRNDEYISVLEAELV